MCDMSILISKDSRIHITVQNLLKLYIFLLIIIKFQANQVSYSIEISVLRTMFVSVWRLLTWRQKKSDQINCRYSCVWFSKQSDFLNAILWPPKTIFSSNERTVKMWQAVWNAFKKIPKITTAIYQWISGKSKVERMQPLVSSAIGSQIQPIRFKGICDWWWLSCPLSWSTLDWGYSFFSLAKHVCAVV